MTPQRRHINKTRARLAQHAGFAHQPQWAMAENVIFAKLRKAENPALISHILKFLHWTVKVLRSLGEAAGVFPNA